MGSRAARDADGVRKALAESFAFCSHWPMSRRFDEQTINLALSILYAHLCRIPAFKVDGSDFRLALRVIHRHVPDCAGTRELWRHASSDLRHPWESGTAPYREIVGALTKAGWTIDRPLTDWPTPRD